VDISLYSHQEALCCKSSKMDHIMQVVVRTVNFIRARGLDHRRFDSLLSDKAFFIYVGKLKICVLTIIFR